ncbi:MAG: sigma-70 family RNA polymerase sigma factor [Bacteroidaceae bacterium]|nr:sigma-70 family RNA polymerase sigma factor [Bacteroidaceae bacterium]
METNELDFTRIVREYKGTIYTVCYMFSKDEDEVNDLFQEVLINLWKGIGKFRNECSMNTFIYRVSLNTCISVDRKNKRTRQKERLSMNANLFSDEDNDAKQIRQLYDRIHRLGPVDRAIVLLWLDNVSYEEIGQIIGISTKNVSVKLVRIKEQLKQM